VIDFRVSFDNAEGVWQVLSENHIDTTLTAADLTPGFVYTFKVEARNEFGWSEVSDLVTILCAGSPDAPSQPSTSVLLDEVILDWEAPFDGGTEITHYTVYIRKADLAYIVDATLCDGGQINSITSTSCTLKLSDLRSVPFYLNLGYHIFIQVQAHNAYGSSALSIEGNGGVMVDVPDAPVNLQDNTAVTSDSVIEFTWEDGLSDGDRPI